MGLSHILTLRIMCCIGEPATCKVQLHAWTASSLLLHVVGVNTHACLLSTCSAEMLGSDGSVRPCVVKTVCYSNKLALHSTGPDAAIAAQHLKVCTAS